MSADTATPRNFARATSSIINGAAARMGGKKRGPDRRFRRHSFDTEDPRARVWRPINGGGAAAGMRWRDTLLKVAREYDQVGKQKGRMGPLGPHTREVLASLLDLVDFATGRLEPSYAKLMAMTGYARSTISSALRRLRAHGFLDWVRRSHLVDTDEGQAREQTSNAFFFELSRMPKHVWRRFRDLLGRRERVAAGTGPGAEPAAPRMVLDPELAAILARMQARFDEGAE